MNTKTATIIDIKATDRTRYAQATQVSWSRITFTTDSVNFLTETNPKRTYESNHELCFVHRTISSEQKGLNGIHHRELEHAKPYKEVLHRIISKVEDDYIVCHDAQLTRQILINAVVRVDNFKFICLSTLVKNLYPKLGSYTIPTLIYEFCENTAIDYMPHNWHGRYDATFVRHILKQVCILNNLNSMDDIYRVCESVTNNEAKYNGKN